MDSKTQHSNSQTCGFAPASSSPSSMLCQQQAQKTKNKKYIYILNGYSNASTVPVVGENGEGGVGWRRGLCELGILWSNIVRELRNKKEMGNTDLTLTLTN